MSSIDSVALGPDHTPYDQIPYPGSAVLQAHPNRLAAMARLFGIAAASPSSARVLELGCSDGGNLLPMAETAPHSTFLGIDASKVQIEAGQKVIQAVGLRNVELRHQDILTFSEEEGLFDYIIVHGIYSWVPAPVREKILSIAATNLSPNGIAYISYNALPGATIVSSLRELLFFHTAAIPDTMAKLKQARALCKFLSDSVSIQNNAYGLLLREELQRVERSSDFYFRHEFLAEENTAFYFHEFHGQATRHGLQYVSEPSLARMSASNFAGKADESPATIKELVAQEQFQDILRNCRFRQTLLCRSTVAVRRRIAAGSMRDFAFQSCFQGPKEGIDLTEGVSVDFTIEETPCFKVSGAFLKAVCQILSEAPGRAISYVDLLATARKRSRPVVSAVAVDRNEFEEVTLQNDLMNLCANGFVVIHAEPVEVNPAVPEKPCVSRLVRHQALHSLKITNCLHQCISPNVLTRHTITECNGNHTHDEILSALLARIAEGKIAIADAGQPIVGEARLRVVMRPLLDRVLGDLALQGFFL